MDLETSMLQKLDQFWCDEGGQDLLEYSMLLTFFAIATLALASASSSTLSNIWTNGNSLLTTAVNRVNGG